MNKKARPELDATALHHYRTQLAVRTGRIASLSEAADDAIRRATAEIVARAPYDHSKGDA